MNIEGKIAIVCITENGRDLAVRINSLIDDCRVYQITSKKDWTNSQENCVKKIDKRLSDFVADIFNKFEYIIFIMATGIVVRSIAPYIKSKFTDPAILVMDEKGNNVISLLSGHLGGANELTQHIAHLIGANPVITTATDVNGKASLDMIAKKLNAYIDNFRDNVKEVNSMLVNKKCVGLYIDELYDIDSRGFKELKNIDDLKEGYLNENIEKIVVVTDKKDLFINNVNLPINFVNSEISYIDKDFTNNYIENKTIKVVPRDIVIGIGCRKNTDSGLLYNSLVEFLEKYNIDIKSIHTIGSIELKKDEKAIIDLSKKLEVPFKIFSIKEISNVDGLFEKSDFVKKNVGVFSVAEPVAYLLSRGNLIIEKHKYKGITFSVGRIRL